MTGSSVLMAVPLNGCGSTLRALGHLTAIFFQVFRQVIRTGAALLVAGHREINELRVRQMEVFHDAPELFQCAFLAESGITFFFLGNAGDVPTLVVMGRV